MNPEVMESMIICGTVVGVSVLVLILFCMLIAIGYFGSVIFDRLQNQKKMRSAQKEVQKTNEGTT